MGKGTRLGRMIGSLPSPTTPADLRTTLNLELAELAGLAAALPAGVSSLRVARPTERERLRRILADLAATVASTQRALAAVEEAA